MRTNFSKILYQTKLERVSNLGQPIALWKPGVKGKQSKERVEYLEAHNRSEDILSSDLDAHQILMRCPDFLYERNALANLIESRGHILITSVICHPEMAGCGIEYAWGFLKFTFRKMNEARRREKIYKFGKKHSSG